MSKASAAVLRAHDAPFVIEELDVEGPRADEAVVRLVSVGLCRTDLLARQVPAAFRGPAVYGHEGAGVVEEIGSAVTKVVPGDHVVLSFRSCQRCAACNSGHPAYCPRFARLNGGASRDDGSKAFADADGSPVGSHYFGQSSFASRAVVSETSIVKVDSSADLTKVGPLGCAVQTGAGAVFNVFDVQAGQSIVVAGAGAVGLAAIMAAKFVGAGRVIALDRHDNRLSLARKVGATDTLNVGPADIAHAVKRCTGGAGSDFALDLTGNTRVIRSCFEALNYNGTLGLCGAGSGELALDMAMLMSGRSIKAVIEGDAVPEKLIPQLIRYHAEGRFPFDELIQTFPLEQINEAVQASNEGRVIKPVLLFD